MVAGKDILICRDIVKIQKTGKSKTITLTVLQTEKFSLTMQVMCPKDDWQTASVGPDQTGP